MNKKIIRILLVSLIAGAIALTGCGDQAKEAPETNPPFGVTENGVTEDGGITSSDVDIDLPEVDRINEGADNPTVLVIKKPEEIKTLADLKNLNNWNTLYFYLEKMVNERPISEYDERFAEMNFEGSWEGGIFYRDLEGGIIYGFQYPDDMGDLPKKLNGDEVCLTMYLSLDRLFPNTKWPKNADEMRELLGIDIKYETEAYEISASGNLLSASFPEIKLNFYIPVDESGLVPEGNYSIVFYYHPDSYYSYE